MTDEAQVLTFGCRLNTFESEVMRNHAKAAGLKDTVIVNTCAVTNEAERQARQAIRRLNRENPDAKIIVTGCSAQINPEAYKDMPGVSRVLGNIEKMQPESFIPDHNHADIHVSDIMEVKETAGHLISGFENRVRAFIEIQNGCDHRCTFCRIPYGRGNNRSVPIAEITKQVQTLVASGCKEVVFTGVDITGYGTDLPGTPTLGQMTRRVLQHIPELPRLRLSSIDPAELDQDVFHLIQYEPRLMPHFHISLQAGADLILKRMKRRHLRQDIIDFCQRVRSLRKDVTFGADIIAGFPTETDEHHQQSLDLLDECGLTYMHVFPYSAVDNTPAARMPQVPGNVIKERAAALRNKGKERLKQHLAQLVGRTDQVLVENPSFGHGLAYTPVEIQGSCTTGDLVNVEIIAHNNKNAIGKVIE
ncbi:MAG: tRNA (N(6)-L-threonylcarbamoyladenosine(37)-C(2))-methylthiotransferase MtaB [Alphaproteobacteria bacterium]